MSEATYIFLGVKKNVLTDDVNTNTEWQFGPFYKADEDRHSIHDLSIPVDEETANSDRLYAVIGVWTTGDSYATYVDSDSEMFSIHTSRKQAEHAAAILLEGIVNTPMGNGYVVPPLPWNGEHAKLSKIMIIDNSPNEGVSGGR